MMRRSADLSNKKRFRTGILIEEQFKYIKQYEYELILRNLEHKIINSDENQTNFNYLTQISDDFVYSVKGKSPRPISCNDLNIKQVEDEWNDNQTNFEEEKEFEVELMYQTNENLLKNYYRNLIRLNVVKKFNIELDFHRIELNKAMRNQLNLKETRNKVQWLENEIEKIILSNKNIGFPLQLKLLSDQSLRVEKIDKSLLVKPVEPEPEPELEIKQETPAQELTAEELEMNKIANMLSMWDKKSESSEISFSDVASSNQQEDLNEESIQTAEKEIPEEAKIQTVEKEILEEAKIEEETLENEVNTLPMPSVLESEETFIAIRREETFLTDEPDNLTEDDDDEDEELQVYDDNLIPSIEPINDPEQEPQDLPFYLLPHNRFEFPDYSKKMVALNLNSYHRLGLSLTDSYVHDENLIDGKCPVVQNKELLDINDIKLQSLASRIESIYKAICKSTDQFKPSNLPELTSNSRISRSSRNERMSALSLASSKRFKSVQPIPRKSVAFKPKAFEPQQIETRLTPLQQSKKNLNTYYPRDPQVYSLSAPMQRNFKYPPRLVNQHNLKEQTRFRLYWPDELNINELKNEVAVNEETKLKEELYKVPEVLDWQQLKPDPDSGLKLEKIRTLLNVDLKANVLDQKRDAIRHIGLLKIGDHGVLFALNNILNNEKENELIKFESSKSLVLLGDWNENVCQCFIKYLKNGNWNVRHEIMNTIINSKNTQFNKEIPTVKILTTLLEQFTIVKFDERAALNSSICVGKLGFKNSKKALNCLHTIVDCENNSSDFWYLKTLALEALVKHFDKKDNKTIHYILNQIENSPLWISRVSAMQLLAYLGSAVVCRSDSIEKVYKLLEVRLSDDPIWEVRLEVGNTIKELQLFEKVFARMSKNLESTDADMRGKAVIAMEMLGVKKAKVLQNLIDMLELDNNEHVRTLVLKALFSLAPNNPKVLFAFNSLEKNSRIYQVFCKLKDQKNKSKLLAKREVINKPSVV